MHDAIVDWLCCVHDHTFEGSENDCRKPGRLTKRLPSCVAVEKMSLYITVYNGLLVRRELAPMPATSSRTHECAVRTLQRSSVVLVRMLHLKVLQIMNQIRWKW